MAETPEVARLRRNLGDTGAQPAFSGPELDTLLAEAGGDEDRALLAGLWELLAQGAKWHDYTTDVSQERKSQMFDHLKDLYAIVQARVAAAETATGGGGANRRPARSTAVRVQSVF